MGRNQNFVIVRGTFHVEGYQPDGDSVRFLPQGLPPLRKNMRQIRFEAIDAPETHYKGCHQPQGIAFEAQRQLVQRLGFTTTTPNINRTLYTSAPEKPFGTIIYRSFDGYKRPISWVFTGDPFPQNRHTVRAEDVPFTTSVNYFLAAMGAAYPCVYSTTEPAGAAAIRAAATDARFKGFGVWREDESHSFSVQVIEDLSVFQLIFPKFFRRIIDFGLVSHSMEGFEEYLKSRKDRYIWQGESHALADGLKVEGTEFHFVPPLEEILWEV